jgi:hypothetical protein
MDAEEDTLHNTRDQMRDRSLQRRDALLLTILDHGATEPAALAKILGWSPVKVIVTAQEWPSYFHVWRGAGRKGRSIGSVEVHRHLQRVA